MNEHGRVSNLPSIPALALGWSRLVGLECFVKYMIEMIEHASEIDRYSRIIFGR